VCAQAPASPSPDPALIQQYFSSQTQAYQVLADDAGAGGVLRDQGLLTGYYEPELAGRLAPDERFRVPLYRLPPQGISRTRAQIESRHLLAGQELVWLEDPIEAFFVEVQGSALIRLDDGSRVRLAYAGNNGQAYRSIGSWLIEQHELDDNHLSMQSIQTWARAHPGRVRDLLDADPRVVFFKLEAVAPSTGPRGSLGTPLTPGVSAAIDPRYMPLGAPIIVMPRSVDGGQALAADLMPARVLVALDTGAAIRGPLRLDWFWGSGSEAADIAGHQRALAAMIVLVPRGVAPEQLLRH
jgi:membrane-bound lytic murein transglycosylase A